MKTFGAFLIGVCSGLAIVLIIWAFAGWGNVAKYDTAISADMVENVLANRGLEICGRTTLDFDKTPGFVEGRTVTVSTNCSADENPMRVSLLMFDSEASRNAALQRASSTHRGGFGPHLAYGYGPYVITIQGNRGIGAQILLSQALTDAGAKP